MNNVIKIKTGLAGPIPPRFNCADDDRLELPKLFRYRIKYDPTTKLFHLFGKRIINGVIVDWTTSEHSKIRAIAYYHSVIPDLRVVH